MSHYKGHTHKEEETERLLKRILPIFSFEKLRYYFPMGDYSEFFSSKEVTL